LERFLSFETGREHSEFFSQAKQRFRLEGAPALTGGQLVSYIYFPRHLPVKCCTRTRKWWSEEF